MGPNWGRREASLFSSTMFDGSDDDSMPDLLPIGEESEDSDLGSEISSDDVESDGNLLDEVWPLGFRC